MPARPDRYPASAWRRSRASADQGACVEIRVRGSSVQVRDSRDKNSSILEIPFTSWVELMQRIRKGELAAADANTSPRNVNHKIKRRGYIRRAAVAIDVVA